MSNDKSEATYHGGYRADWPNPGTTYPQPKGPMFSRPLLWTILVLALGVVALLAVIFVKSSDTVPASVPVLGKDTGVAVCEAMASGTNPAGQPKGTELTLEKVREVRALFADSRYPEIRVPGVKMMDLAAQMSGAKEDDLGLLTLVSPFTEAYAALSGGCSQHGFEIPPMSKA